jgi:hypothetical protein
VASGWLEFIYHCQPLNSEGRHRAHYHGTGSYCSSMLWTIWTNPYEKPIMSATPNSPQHPLTRMRVGPKSWSGDYGDGKKITCPCQEPNHNYLSHIAQSLQWVSYPRSLFYIKKMYLYMPWRHTQLYRYTSPHLTPALDRGKKSASFLSSFKPRKGAPGTYWIRRLVDGI